MKKRSSHHKAKQDKRTPKTHILDEHIPDKSKSYAMEGQTLTNSNKQEKYSKDSIGGMNYNEYIGQMVTVYVDAGGIAGKGFTGILMGQTDLCISILVLPSVLPSCSMRNTCSSKSDNILFCLFCPYNDNSKTAMVAEITKISIVALVHN
jgi:hypothetical protein